MNDLVPETKTRHPATVLLAMIITFPIAYYITVLFHEWGHGTTAWLFGYKNSPFDIKYGGYMLLHCDEAVPYTEILKTGHGVQAALIGISGFTVSTCLFLFALFSLNTKFGTRSVWVLSTMLWCGVLNMMAIFGYIPLDTFSVQGDIGRFVHGLDISPWLVFIPGSLLVALCLYRLLGHGMVRFYIHAPIKTLAMRRFLLAFSLSIIFLLLYTHGYNPYTDKGANIYSRILAGFSVLLVPILFFVCNPSNAWIKRIEKKMRETSKKTTKE